MFGQPNFPGMVRPIDLASICLSLEEVAECAGREVLMKVVDNGMMMVGILQWILGQQLRPLLIHLLNIIIILNT